MKRKLSILLIIIITITSSISYGEIGIEKDLRSYILADVKTGEVLEEHNIDEVVEIASISKLMSYLVVMDQLTKKDISLDHRIIVDEDVASVKGSSLKLEEGEVFTIRELIEASMVVSANDATYALAKYIAGTEESFTKLMNEKAKEIGLNNARFYNSTGLPIGNNGIQNRMTTREIFQLSKYIIENYPEILEITRIPAIEVFSRGYLEQNTNPLLRKMKEVDGLKTGFTNKAGYCYVSTFNIAEQANVTEDLRLISIVMGAKGLQIRNELSEILVQYGIDNYSNRVFFQEDLPIQTIELPKARVQEIETYPREGFSKVFKNDEEIKVKIEMDEKIKLPIKKDKKIGKAIIEKDNEVIFETDIITKENIKKARWYMLLGRKISGLYDKFNSLLN